MSRADRLARIGMLVGTAVAALVLVALAVALLSVADTSLKVLAAVWFWLAPILGLGAGAGWLVGRLLRRGAHERS